MRQLFPFTGAVMRYPFGQYIARFVMMLAICLQPLLPGTLSFAQSNGIDVSRYICVTPGQALTAESKETALRLAKLLGDDLPADLESEEHCPICTLAEVAFLPDPLRLPEDIVYKETQVAARFMPGLVHKSQGPPLGSRAPPAHI